ncbi:MAG: PqqD family protein [Solirubrobacteraceae bacterium]
MDAPETGIRRFRGGLLTERIGDEVIIVDQDSGRAHCLSGLAAAIWDQCDGTHDVTQLAELSGATAVPIEAALAELDELSLLEPVAEQSQDLTRRTVARRAINVGAGALVFTAVLPAVASAASKIGPGLNAPNCTAAPGAIKADPECSSGNCYQTRNGSSKTCTTPGCVPFGGLCLLGLGQCCGGNVCNGLLVLTCSN